METILYFVAFILAFGLWIYGLYVLRKLIIYLLPKRLKRKWISQLILLIIIVSINIYIFTSPSLINKRAVLHMPNDMVNSIDSSILDEIVEGIIAYEIPNSMTIGNNYKATAIISKAINDSIIFQEFNSQYFQREEIKISSIVNVFLIDPTENNFNITSLNTIEQLVDDSTNTVWNWYVTPKRSGDNKLALRVTVKILNRLGENYKDIKVFEKSIIVNAPILSRIKQFITDYWQWLSTVIFIPLSIWVSKILFTHRKKIDDRKRKQIGFT